MTTSAPALVSSDTTAGTRATRRSPGKLSFGIPTIMAASVSAPGPLRVHSEQRREVHPERTDRAHARVVDAGGPEASRLPVEPDGPWHGRIVRVVDGEVDERPLVRAVAVDDDRVVQLDGGEVRDEPLDGAAGLKLGHRLTRHPLLLRPEHGVRHTPVRPVDPAPQSPREPGL